MKKYRILIAEDDKDIIEVLKLYLENEGYEVESATDGAAALRVIQNEEVDLGLFDLMMPKMNGYDLIREVRRNYNMPIIILSAKREDSDKIIGLDIGADDYLTKPFSSTELLLRVKALLKRPHMNVADKDETSKIVIQDIVLDKDLRQVIRDGKEIPLTEIEYRILLLLASNRNRIFTAKEIYENVWQEAFMPNSTNTVMVHIRNIRKKLGDTGPSPKYLHNSWGRGYRVV